MLRHDTRTTAQDYPCEKRSDKGIAQTDPGGGNTEFPTKLAGISDKDNRRKIGCTVGKGRQPRAHVSTAEDEAVDVRGMLAAVQADTDEYCKVKDQDSKFHNTFPHS